MTLIETAARQDWKAAAWRLERMHAAKWGRKDKLTIEHLTVDEIEAEIRKLEAELALNDETEDA